MKSPALPAKAPPETCARLAYNFAECFPNQRPPEESKKKRGMRGRQPDIKPNFPNHPVSRHASPAIIRGTIQGVCGLSCAVELDRVPGQRLQRDERDDRAGDRQGHRHGPQLPAEAAAAARRHAARHLR